MTAVRLDPTVPRVAAISVTVAVRPDRGLDPGSDCGGVAAAGVDQESPDGVAAGALGDVAGVGDEEAVFGCGREFGDDPDVVESDSDELVGARVLEPQVDGVAGKELEVVHGFGADQHRVGPRSQLVHQLLRGAALKVVVVQRGDSGDAGRVDPVEVLQVGSDVGETVLERFDRPDPGIAAIFVPGLAARRCPEVG